MSNRGRKRIFPPSIPRQDILSLFRQLTAVRNSPNLLLELSFFASFSGQVSHTFTTDLLNQILFAEQAFREDFKSLIKRLKSSDNKIKSMLVSEAEPEHSSLVADKPPLLFSLQVEKYPKFPRKKMLFSSKN